MSQDIDPALVGLIAEFGHCSADVGYADAEFDADRCAESEVFDAQKERDTAKQALHDELAKRAARHRRADELLAQCAEWFQQNEAKLKNAGIGGFRLPPEGDSAR